MSHFEFNVLRIVGFWKKGCIQTITFWITLLHESNINYNFCAPSQSMILKQEFRDVSDWEENVTTCHNLKHTYEIVSEFENKRNRKVRFWIVLLHENDFFAGFALIQNEKCYFRNLTTQKVRRKKLDNPSNFELKFVQMSEIKKTFAFLKLRYKRCNSIKALFL